MFDNLIISNNRSPVNHEIENSQAHLEGADDPNDYVLMRFEDKFERDLHLYDLDIEEEIRLSIPPEKRKK